MMLCRILVMSRQPALRRNLQYVVTLKNGVPSVALKVMRSKSAMSKEGEDGRDRSAPSRDIEPRFHSNLWRRAT